ncbi:MAG: helix-turn-helix domain-containing protein [Rhizobiaceae bacterium]|nr:helix-turn-helix domain-containing protein [Rhizobiaceae bacterium]
MTIAERDIMSGLVKGLAVIETFTAERPRQSISEAAAACGLDRATTRRCLLTLAHEGYSDYDGKYFTLTPRVLRLGIGCLAAMPLPRLIQPLLDSLSEQINESTSVSILDGAEIVYVARAAQRKVMSIGLMPGSRLPAYCTSMGRVMLAALPDGEARARLGASPLPARTPATLTDPDTIMIELERVRAQGYAKIDQEVQIGLRSVAVPLHNIHGHTIAALNVGVAATANDMDDLVERTLPALTRVARDVRMFLR